MRVLVSLIVALNLCGCGDDGGGAPLDGAPGDAATGGPATPAPPALPDLGPCPAGWRTVDVGGVGVCEPWPETGVASCSPDQAHFPGEPGCTPIGTPCGAGDFAADLPADRPVVYVAPGGTGDGSMAAPYGRIRDGARGAGNVVALAKGTYEELVTIGAGVTVWGACVAETLLTTTLASDRGGVVTTDGLGAELRNVRVGDSPRPGLYLADPGRSLHVEGVLVSGAREAGVLTLGANDLTAHELVVRDTEPTAAGGAGRGVEITFGGTAELDRIVLERNREYAVVATRDAVITMTDSAVRDTDAQLADLRDGRGLWVRERSSVTVERSVFENNRVVQVYVVSGGSLSLDQSIVRDGREDAVTGLSGRGLGAELGGAATVRRSLFERNRMTHVFVAGDSTFVGEDIIARDGLAQGDGSGGRAFTAQSNTTVELHRVLMLDLREIAMAAVLENAHLLATDVTVRNVEADEASGVYGRTLALGQGAHADVQRAILEGARDVSVFLSGTGTTATLADVVVRDTRGRVSDDRLGVGVAVQLGAALDGERLLLEDNRHLALMSIGLQSRADVLDVIVRGVLPSPCEETSCAGLGAGMGFGSYEDAAMTVGSFEVGDASVCGVHIADRGSLDLADGAVHDCTIGACVQVDGFDVARLTDGVAYLDNGTNLDATTLPIPDPADDLVAL